nr:MAG TPA: hypothetical protein [Caudoviricetes sp.]
MVQGLSFLPVPIVCIKTVYRLFAFCVFGEQSL